MPAKRQPIAFKLAIVYLIWEGRSQTDIANEFGLNIKTVNRWWIKLRHQFPMSPETMQELQEGLVELKSELESDIEYCKGLRAYWDKHPVTRRRQQTISLIEQRLFYEAHKLREAQRFDDRDE